MFSCRSRSLVLEVFKRYSQAKLTMMREGLAKLDRNANQASPGSRVCPDIL
jgi:hypothetical protein